MANKTPEYSLRASRNYISKMERIILTIKPEDKIRIKRHANASGQSMTAYIMEAVDNRIKSEYD